MSFRTWMYVFAIIGLTSPALVQTEEEESEQRQAEQQDTPAYEPPLPFPVKILEDTAAADARARGEEEARQREIAALAAQEGMNAATQAIKDATLDMRDSAQISTLLVGIGTIFLFATIWLTWRAVRDTRDIGQKQVRAYIALKDCRIDGIAKGQKATAFLNFVNSGQSPCYITATSIGIGFEPTPIQATPVLATEPKSSPSSEGHGGVFAHSVSTKREISSQEFAAYAAGKMGFVVTCQIIYRDVFDIEHETRVSVYRTAQKPATPSGLSVLSIGNKHT